MMEDKENVVGNGVLIRETKGIVKTPKRKSLAVSTVLTPLKLNQLNEEQSSIKRHDDNTVESTSTSSNSKDEEIIKLNHALNTEREKVVELGNALADAASREGCYKAELRVLKIELINSQEDCIAYRDEYNNIKIEGAELFKSYSMKCKRLKHMSIMCATLKNQVEQQASDLDLQKSYHEHDMVTIRKLQRDHNDLLKELVKHQDTEQRERFDIKGIEEELCSELNNQTTLCLEHISETIGVLKGSIIEKHCDGSLPVEGSNSAGINDVLNDKIYLGNGDETIRGENSEQGESIDVRPSADNDDSVRTPPSLADRESSDSDIESCTDLRHLQHTIDNSMVAEFMRIDLQQQKSFDLVGQHIGAAQKIHKNLQQESYQLQESRRALEDIIIGATAPTTSDATTSPSHKHVTASYSVGTVSPLKTSMMDAGTSPMFIPIPTRNLVATATSPMRGLSPSPASRNSQCVSPTTTSPGSIQGRLESLTISNEILRDSLDFSENELRRLKMELATRAETEDSMKHDLESLRCQLEEEQRKRNQMEFDLQEQLVNAQSAVSSADSLFMDLKSNSEKQLAAVKLDYNKLNDELKSFQEISITASKQAAYLYEANLHCSPLLHHEEIAMSARLLAILVAKDAARRGAIGSVEALHTRCSFYETQLSVARRDLANVNAVTEEQISEHKKERKNLEKDLRLAYHKHKKELSTLEAEYRGGEYRTRYENVVVELAAAEGRVDLITGVVTDLHALMQTQAEAMSEMKSILLLFQRYFDAIDTGSVATETEITMLREACQEAISAKISAQDALSRVAEHENIEITQFAKQATLLQAEVTELRNKLEELQTEHDTISSENAELQESTRMLIEERFEMEHKLNNLNEPESKASEIERLKAELADSRLIYVELEEFSKEERAIRGEVDTELENQLQRAESEIETCRAELRKTEKVQEQNTALIATINKLKIDAANREVESKYVCDQLRSDIDAYEAAEALMMDEMRDMGTKNDENITIMQEKIDRLTVLLGEARNKIVKMNDQANEVERLSEAAAHAHSQVCFLRAELLEKDAALESTTKNFQKALEALDGMEDKCGTITSEERVLCHDCPSSELTELHSSLNDAMEQRDIANTDLKRLRNFISEYMKATDANTAVLQQNTKRAEDEVNALDDVLSRLRSVLVSYWSQLPTEIVKELQNCMNGE